MRYKILSPFQPATERLLTAHSGGRHCLHDWNQLQEGLESSFVGKKYLTPSQGICRHSLEHWYSYGIYIIAEELIIKCNVQKKETYFSVLAPNSSI